ncbi:hypothetical protein M9H77_26943 [Catharanthus roseus]|uniref:Uncharacterized protein n=1 Tax=Catharanthus roseus TaxID=4058 RepID=A0ACC0ABB0_CATRO|nr:hypothetical protein M9H77_26943 [Catharanthus roseus]
MSIVYGNERKDSSSIELSRLVRNEMASALSGKSVLGLFCRVQYCDYMIQAYIPVVFGCTIRLLDHSTSASSGHVKYFCWDPQLNTEARDDFDSITMKWYRQLMHNVRIASKKLTCISQDIYNGLVGCSVLASLTRSFTKSFMFIKKGTTRRASSSMSDLTSSEWKKHERRTTGTLMRTDHDLMLELNEGLRRGMLMTLIQRSLSVCALSPAMLPSKAAHSMVVMRSIWLPPVRGDESGRGGLATRIISYMRWAVENFRSIGLDPSQMLPLDPPPELCIYCYQFVPLQCRRSLTIRVRIATDTAVAIW